MKNLVLVFLSLHFYWVTFSQQSITVDISGNIFNLQKDSMAISQFYGTHYKDFSKFPVDKKGNFSVKASLPAKDIYVLRVSDNQHLNLILREGSALKIYGDGKNIVAFHNIVGSEESAQLNKFVVQLQTYNQKKDSANAYLQQHPEQEKEVNESFTPIYYAFENYKQTFLAENPNSPALLPLLSTIDPTQNFKGYELVVDQIVKGFDGSPAVNNIKAMYLQQKAKYEETLFLSPGNVAPIFSQAKADGKQLSLTDLKGQYVLLDFWASWCGPCRKENPNVVRLYQKYAPKGFTVMSVSLDKDKLAWQDAIKKDNLIWTNHVSDLKGWANEAAQLYKVNGIPFTVLIDKEGKIVQKNLRGEELEKTLQSIFGF